MAITPNLCGRSETNWLHVHPPPMMIILSPSFMKFQPSVAEIWLRIDGNVYFVYQFKDNNSKSILLMGKNKMCASSPNDDSYYYKIS